MEQTSGIRQDVKDFMRECERFFGFAHQSGGLTQEECRGPVILLHGAKHAPFQLL
jgi:hypothetical protein